MRNVMMFVILMIMTLSYILYHYAFTFSDRIQILNSVENANAETQFMVLYEFERVSGHKHFAYRLIGRQKYLYNERMYKFWS